VKTLLLVGVIGVVVVVVAFFVIANVLSGGEKTDCDTFFVAAGEWDGATFEERQALVKGMQDCRTLHGRRPSGVVQLLGPPSERTDDSMTYPMPYENDQQFLRIVLVEGVVDRLFVEAPSGPPRP
jgi:hypothetical protein